jgi:tetratricopeptide (TPR) repeat protein
MKKESVLFGIIGILIGSVIGFMVANNLNRTAITTATGSASSNSSNPAFPPGHPPIGGEMGEAPGGQQAGSMPQITESIEKAKQNPDDFEAQMTAGDLYYQISRFDDASKFFEAAAKLKPAEREPLIKLGNSSFESEKYTDAEAWYAKALEKDPKDVNVRTDYGLTFYLREPRDLPRAIKEYNAALAIDPNREITLQNLALAYADAADKANLATTLERLKKINPENPAIKKIEARPPGS